VTVVSTTYFAPDGQDINTIDEEQSDGSSIIGVQSSDGTFTATFFKGPHGTGTVSRIDQENPDGTSQITNFNSDGSSTSTTYADPNGTGSVLRIDQENPDGTSRIRIFNPDGSNTTTDYGGPNGSGTIERIDTEFPNGTSQITQDGKTTMYDGPNGTGNVMGSAQATTGPDGVPVLTGEGFVELVFYSAAFPPSGEILDAKEYLLDANGNISTSTFPNSAVTLDLYTYAGATETTTPYLVISGVHVSLFNDISFIPASPLPAGAVGDSVIVENGPGGQSVLSYVFINFGQSILGDGPQSHQAVDGEFVQGGSGPDTIYGASSGGDTILGGTGNNYIAGGGGSDSIAGGGGSNTIQAGTGIDIINAGAGDATVYGSLSDAGQDTITGGAGNDYLAGGAGSDLIQGGNGADTIQAGSGNDTIQGGSGPETIYGSLSSSGTDTIYAGSGNDYIHGEAGTDSIQGGTGTDILEAGAGNDTIEAGSGITSIYGGAGADLLEGSQIGPGAYIVGGSGNDTMIGGAGNDTLVGSQAPAHPNITMMIAGSLSEEIADAGFSFNDTVVGFSQAAGDFIDFENESSANIDSVVAMQQNASGNTTLVLPDGANITLLGIAHIDASVFSHA